MKDKLIVLGKFISDLLKGKAEKEYQDGLLDMIEIAHAENSFFNKKNILDALETLQYNLQESALLEFEKNTPKVLFSDERVITILVAEKDILSGVSDWIMSVLTNHSVQFQLPENNRRFIPALVSWFVALHPDYNLRVSYTEGRVAKPELLYTYPIEKKAQQLMKYFSNYPGKVRQMQKSVAILDGDENEDTLKALVEGVMKFFNQGSYAISKIFVPKGYDFIPLLESFGRYDSLKNHHGYLKNYDYYKSIYLLNRENFFDNEVILLKEEQQQVLSPLSVLYFEYYDDLSDIEGEISREEVAGVYSSFIEEALNIDEASIPLLYQWEFDMV